jgi:large subunit ribosomal protein L10
MTREEKYEVVEKLTEKLRNTDYFYITDAGGMTVAETNNFRRLCFEKGIGYQVFKNSLIKKALANLEAENSNADFKAFEEKKVLKGFSGILFGTDSANAPAKLLKEFHKKGDKKNPKPLLKGASINLGLFTGHESLDALATLKSKNELIGDIIGALQAPAQNVVSALQSSGGKLAGILKTLSEKE